MAKIKLYADEHVPSVVIKILRQSGFDIKTVFEAGNVGQSDLEQLKFSIGEKKVMLTHDSDFLKITKVIEHFGLIYIAKPLQQKI